jgi:hypothetical protein
MQAVLREECKPCYVKDGKAADGGLTNTHSSNTSPVRHRYVWPCSFRGLFVANSAANDP